MYEATAPGVCASGLDNPIDKEERIREVQTQARQRLQVAKIDEAAHQSGLGRLRRRLFPAPFRRRNHLAHPGDSQARATSAAAAGHELATIQVRGGTEIFIYTRDQDNLFALITSILDQLGLTILDARIMTGHSGYTLDSFTVLEDSGALDPGPAAHQGNRHHALHHAPANPMPRRCCPADTSRGFRKRFKCRPGYRSARTPPTAAPWWNWYPGIVRGLLCRVGQAFMECGVQLHNAKIATIGARVEDVFFVTDRENRPLNDPGKYATLRAALVEQLDSAEE
ncbi:MAG: hypothetical protein MZV65_30435 [Chromatiales bacterium]|nr:hypothetical protein [Chromatiales bacterium]